MSYLVGVTVVFQSLLILFTGILVSDAFLCALSLVNMLNGLACVGFPQHVYKKIEAKRQQALYKRVYPYIGEEEREVKALYAATKTYKGMLRGLRRHGPTD